LKLPYFILEQLIFSQKCGRFLWTYILNDVAGGMGLNLSGARGITECVDTFVNIEIGR
jgi:hypothetical protein